MPEDTVWLALTFEDLDADPETRAHWVIAEIQRVDDRPITRNTSLFLGINDFGVEGYEPPCPPAGGGLHRYRFTLHAVCCVVFGWAEHPTAEQLRNAIRHHTSGEATLTVTYER